jgi:hypothetical protein
VPEAKEPAPWTLGDIKDLHMSLDGICPVEGCGNFYTFDVDRLIETRGRDWIVPDELPFPCADHHVPVKFQLTMNHGPS